MRQSLLVLCILLITGVAYAQPLPVPVPLPLPDPPPGDPADPPADPASPSGDPSPADPNPQPDPGLQTVPIGTGVGPGTGIGTGVGPGTGPGPEPEPPVPSSYDMTFPLIFTAPSGRLVPAAVIWSSTGVHTGGGFYGDLFVGLGEVAEFGIGFTDLIRIKGSPDVDLERVDPFAQASFKMGVGEHRLFRHQPAVALTFRKSFEHKAGSANLRTAALYLMVSKAFGPKVSLHAGGVLVDAAIGEDGMPSYFFHDEGWRNQLRPVVAFEAEPLHRSSIMVELNWVPEFTRAPADVRMSAVLTWGVRYRITNLLAFESGVRIQGIDEANLLDAQIFGQLSWGSDRLRRAINTLR
jgi:hypothetical protein